MLNCPVWHLFYKKDESLLKSLLKVRDTLQTRREEFWKLLHGIKEPEKAFVAWRPGVSGNAHLRPRRAMIVISEVAHWVLHDLESLL